MNNRFCVIGAGSSGLAAAKNLKARGIDCEVIEREDDVGGNWYFGKPNSSVYASTHTISSKPLTEYTDYPMPASYPPYPSHRQIWEYFRAYATHFDLYPHIRFNTSVERIEPADSGADDAPAWRVSLRGADGAVETREYGGLVIANGHNWDPKIPVYPGRFDGESVHSARYKTPDLLRGKRVLVVGAGNSGCDIAVESAQNAAKTFHSARRSYYYAPKFVFGRPADQVAEFFLKMGGPLALRQAGFKLILKATVGLPQDYGLPRPDHNILETHPIINSQMLYFVGHGEIAPKPDIAELMGGQVRFVDGSVEDIDVIVYATGFNITIPFIDRQLLAWEDGRPKLFLNVMHPRFDNLFIIGLIQPDSGQFGLVDYQAQMMAAYLDGLRRNGRSAMMLKREKAGRAPSLSSGIHYVDSTRHYLEVEHFGYRRMLKDRIARLSRN